jgi:hypothetical protein
MTKVAVVLLVLVILGLGGYLLTGNSKKESIVAPVPTTTVQSPTSGTSTPTNSQIVNTLRAGGNSFRDPQGVFVFLYPSDYKLDDQDRQHIRIYKTGATQKGQTEMYDGVIVVFETINLLGQTLEQWIDSSIKQATADGTSRIVEPKTNITQNKYPGFTYTLQGQGTAKYYVLQKDSKSNYAVVITVSVQDPQQKGYQKEVDALLSALELLR